LTQSSTDSGTLSHPNVYYDRARSEAISLRKLKDVNYKEDTLNLDSLPEKELVEFLLAPKSYPQGFLKTVLRVEPGQPNVFPSITQHWGRLLDLPAEKEPRVVLAEECGLFPKVREINDAAQFFIMDPLDGSSILKDIAKNAPGASLDDKLRNYQSMEFVHPSIAIHCIENGKVTATMTYDLKNETVYAISDGIARKFNVDRHTSNSRIWLGIRDSKTVEFRKFQDCDMDRFMCHDADGGYNQNLKSLNMPENMSRYGLKSTPGPARPLYLTTESEEFKPRLIIYNGEKICEWAGALAWAQAGDFNVYVVSNPKAPVKNQHSMAPTENIFRDGRLDFSILNDDPAPARYRETIAIVYKQDKEMNAHFTRLPGSSRFL
jgi:hypothetical protein